MHVTHIVFPKFRVSEALSRHMAIVTRTREYPTIHAFTHSFETFPEDHHAHIA